MSKKKQPLRVAEVTLGNTRVIKTNKGTTKKEHPAEGFRAPGSIVRSVNVNSSSVSLVGLACSAEQMTGKLG